MENPDTWGEPERIVWAALEEFRDPDYDGYVGKSAVRHITDALRNVGLLQAEEGGVPYAGMITVTDATGRIVKSYPVHSRSVTITNCRIVGSLEGEEDGR